MKLIEPSILPLAVFALSVLPVSVSGQVRLRHIGADRAIGEFGDYAMDRDLVESLFEESEFAEFSIAFSTSLSKTTKKGTKATKGYKKGTKKGASKAPTEAPRAEQKIFLTLGDGSHHSHPPEEAGLSSGTRPRGYPAGKAKGLLKRNKAKIKEDMFKKLVKKVQGTKSSGRTN